MYKTKHSNELPSLPTWHPGSTVISLLIEGGWILLPVFAFSLLQYHITYPLENSHYTSARMRVKKADNILELL